MMNRLFNRLKCYLLSFIGASLLLGAVTVGATMKKKKRE